MRPTNRATSTNGAKNRHLRGSLDRPQVEVCSADMVAVRFAEPIDLPALNALDDLCFPLGDIDAEPAAPGEIERGIRDRGVLVAVRDDRIIGYIQYSTTHVSGSDLVFVSGLGVAPRCRQQGIGRQLIEGMIEITSKVQGAAACRYATTTAPGNVAMIGLLCSADFVGIDYVRDYFGAGKDRIYFEREAHDNYDRRADLLLIPVGAVVALDQYLASNDRHLLGIVELPHGWHFEVGRRVALEDSTLMSNEVSVASSFSGTLLAVLTFLFGFAAAGRRASSDVLALAAISIVVSALALVGYTNASGELARIRSGSFVRHMIVSNVLSEFGGVYPVFLLTVVIFLQSSEGRAASGVVCVVSTVLLLIYHCAGVNIIDRYASVRGPRWMWNTYKSAVSLLPVIAYVSLDILSVSWVWSAATGVLLAGGAVACIWVGEEARGFAPGGRVSSTAGVR